MLEPHRDNQNSLNKETLKSLYEKMLLTRLSEEAIQKEYFNDDMKTPVHLGIGTEAINTGVCHSLGSGLKTFGTYRNHALLLTVSEDVDGFFAELYGKATGLAKGKAGSMHMSIPSHGLVMTSAIVSSTVPVAVGTALANKYQGKQDFVAVFFGDGAIEEGVFWESLNFASLHNLKILFVCEDNELAIDTHSQDRRGFKSIRDIVQAYHCHFAQASGASVTEVMKKTDELKNKMIQQPGPAFLHCPYFRYLEHVGIHEDFKSEYRSAPCPSDEELRQLDPIHNFERELEKTQFSSDELQDIRSHVEKRVLAAVEKAKLADFPSADELHKDVLI